MKLILSVSEITTLFKEIQKEPQKMFDLIRKDVKETIGNYISSLLNKNKTLRTMYPINFVPDIKIKTHLDFLLVEMPARYMPFMPNGIGYVSNLLKLENINFQVLDVNIIWYHKYHLQRIKKNFSESKTSSGYTMKDDPWDNANASEWVKDECIEYFKDDIENLAFLIAKSTPKILGFSIHENNRLATKMVLERIKELYPQIIVVVGGYSCYNPIIGPRLFDNYDYMIIGESELTLMPLIRDILQGKKPNNLAGVISPKYDSPDRIFQEAPLLEDLDSIDFPRYDWIDTTLYRDYNGYNLVPITASRGCHWSRCSFCAECFPYRKRDPIKVVDEIEWHALSGFKIFQFNESDVNGDPDTLMSICKEIIRRNLKIILTGQLRIDRRNTKEFFMLLKESGFTALRFGVDAWAKNTLRLQKKGYTMRIIEDNLRNLKSSGIRVAVNIVIGVPGETEYDINETISNIIRFRDCIDIVESINTLILAAGSSYYNFPERYNIKFREDKDILYKTNLGHISPDKWYSVEPYIDHRVRLTRLRKICVALYENGINIGPFAQERILAMEKELGGMSKDESKDAKYTAGALSKIKHEYFSLKRNNNYINTPYLVGSFNEFNLVALKENIYVVPQRIGHMDLSLEKNRNHPDILKFNTIEEVIEYFNLK